MKSVSEAVRHAIEDVDSYKIKAKLTVYKSRVYFDSYTDHKPSFARAEGDTSENPVSEACAYNSTINKIVTVFAHTDGKIYMMVDTSSTPLAVTISAATLPCDSSSRPGIFGNNIWYYNSSASRWYIAVFNPTTLNAGTAACISSNTSFNASFNFGIGCVYPFSATEVMILSYRLGGVRISYVTASTIIHSPARFILPSQVLDSTNIFDLHNSGVVRTSTGINFYLTMSTGDVKGITLSYTTTPDKGIWSDIFTAIQADLSHFDIASSFIYNGRIFLCGLFRRSAQFSSTQRWTFLVWSDDGITFSFDRRVLVSAIQLRFHAILNSTTLYFSASNRIHSEVAPYQVIGTSTDSQNVDLVRVEGNPSSQLMLTAISAADNYVDSSIVKKDCYATLWIQVNTTGTTFEDVKYLDGVIDSITDNVKNGGKGFQVGLVPDGLWHTNNIKYPFYMEIQGRSTIVDRCTDLSNLYQVNARELPWPFVCDLWQYNTLGALVSPGILSHILGSETRLFSIDLRSVCAEYPVFGTDSDYTVSIYGWSRSGKLVTTATQVDPTPLSTLNDQFYPIFILQDEDGVQSTVVGTEVQKSSTYSRPPQTFGQVHSGSYPVSFSIPNPGVGKKLIKVGVRVLAPAGSHTYFTTYYIERVEIPALQMYLNSSPTGFVATPDAGQNNWDVGDEIDNGIIDVTDANGTLISGLVVGEYYALETRGGPWRVAPAGAQYRIFQVNNGSSDTTGSTPPWYGPYTANVPYGMSLLPIDNFDESEYPNMNYRLVFRADTDHIYVRPLYDGNFANNVTDTDWEWHLYDAVPPQKIVAVLNPTNSQPSLHLDKRGVEAVMFSSTPYSAYNFEVVSTWASNNPLSFYGMFGNIGFGYDKDNYIIGYIKQPGPGFSTGSIGIKKVYQGKTYSITEVDCNAVVRNQNLDLRFSFRDGLFMIDVKSTSSATWPARGSQLTYEWDQADADVGPLSISGDFFHVGIYGVIKSPRFRTVGYMSTQLFLSMMPIETDPNFGGGDSDFETYFKGSGIIEILGDLYSFSGVINNGDLLPMGPYQGLVKKTLIKRHKNVVNGFTFPQAYGMTIGKFLWQSDVVNHTAYNSKVLSTSEGLSSTIQNTEFQLVPKLGGKNFYSRKSMQVYGPNLPSGLAKKVWITKSLDNVSGWVNGVPKFYKEGTVVYLCSPIPYESITLLAFKASNGEKDYSISDILKNVCQISGTGISFPGDAIVASQVLTTGQEVEL